MEEEALIKKIKEKLTPIGEEERTLETPNGPKRFHIARYHDPDGREIIEIKGIETSDYILIPRETLEKILEETQKRLHNTPPI